jgi:hypothetical protein
LRGTTIYSTADITAAEHITRHHDRDLHFVGTYYVTADPAYDGGPDHGPRYIRTHHDTPADHDDPGANHHDDHGPTSSHDNDDAATDVRRADNDYDRRHLHRVLPVD